MRYHGIVTVKGFRDVLFSATAPKVRFILIGGNKGMGKHLARRRTLVGLEGANLDGAARSRYHKLTAVKSVILGGAGLDEGGTVFVAKHAKTEVLTVNTVLSR